MLLRTFIVFLILFGLAATSIFTWRYVTKQDVKVAGKLIFAAIIAGCMSGTIYFLENM